MFVLFMITVLGAVFISGFGSVHIIKATGNELMMIIPVLIYAIVVIASYVLYCFIGRYNYFKAVENRIKRNNYNLAKGNFDKVEFSDNNKLSIFKLKELYDNLSKENKELYEKPLIQRRSNILCLKK